jgi:hypothetical protein
VRELVAGASTAYRCHQPRELHRDRELPEPRAAKRPLVAVVGPRLGFRICTCTCVGSVRDSRAGPSITVTAIATSISSTIWMISVFRLLPVTVLAIGKNTPAVLPAAWNNVTSNRLPFVLLYSHVYKTASANTLTMNHSKGLVFPGAKNLGRCQSPQITPTIKLEIRALYFACRRGRT